MVEKEMRILFIRANQGIPDSRVEKEIYSLSKTHTVELLGWDRTQNRDEILRKIVDINDKKFTFYHVAIKAPQGEGFKKIIIPMFKFWLEIQKFIICNGEKYDVIHFCDFDTAALAFFKSKRAGKKIVYDIFDYYADSHSAPIVVKNVIRYMENYIITHSDVVILCSEARIEQIRPARAKKTVIIHNSPSRKIVMSPITLQGANRCKRLVYVGMLSEERYLREMAEVVAERNDIEWHVGGFGILEQYFMELSEKYNNIFFYGKLSYAEALYLESQCDIMTAIYNPDVPNHKYAAPNKFYEALMLGKPIIMLNNTGMDNVVIRYKIGEVINLKQESFKKGFESVLEKFIKLEEAEKEEIKKRCLYIYESYYSWNTMENRILQAYREL